jgi:hypothetical protein
MKELDVSRDCFLFVEVVHVELELKIGYLSNKRGKV